MSNEFKYGVITFKKSVHFENEKNVLIKNIPIVCTVRHESLFSERKKKNNTYPKYTGEYYSHKKCNISAFYKATCEICR